MDERISDIVILYTQGWPDTVWQLIYETEYAFFPAYCRFLPLKYKAPVSRGIAPNRKFSDDRPSCEYQINE